MRDIKRILEKSATLPPQSKVDIVRGMSVHRTKGGIAVLSIHYSSDPDRDPAIHPEWKHKERKTYSSPDPTCADLLPNNDSSFSSIILIRSHSDACENMPGQSPIVSGLFASISFLLTNS